MGWRSLALTFALAAAVTTAGLLLRSRHGEYVELAYQVVARLAGGACLALLLVGLALVVEWLAEVGRRVRRYRDRTLLVLSDALPGRRTLQTARPAL